ncbi:polymorphic toxin type 15 domain-containing protein [Acidocella facilis]|uniref:polymorphic toxin type 15 domain-containing protein n=1 Tax=Acidocella facilis TaxID=525 RepID=UPI00068F691F|nr:polymorphic toxin type 15 domain-containing protein [Acidocella facilis]
MSAFAGAETGGEIGAVGGPIGVAAGIVVGAIVGTALGYGAAKLGQAIHNANEKADEQLKDSDASEPCLECGDALPCFNTPAGQSEAETKKQLQEQQDLINSQTPQQMQDRLDAASQRKADTGSYRPEGDAAKRAETREDFQQKRSTELRRQYKEQGYGAREAKQMAEAQTAEEMKQLDATHALDSIAGGGEDDPMGMGNSSVNRSLGSQWKSRVQTLKDAVKKALQRGDEKMNIRLEPCED